MTRVKFAKGNITGSESTYIRNEIDGTIEFNHGNIDSKTGQVENHEILLNGVPYSQTQITELPTQEDSTRIAVGDSINTAFSKLDKIIKDNELVVAAALNDLNDRKVNLNDLANVATTGNYNDLVNAPDLSSYYTSKQIDQNFQTKITQDNKISADLVTSGNINQFVTQSDKTTWNNKQDVLTAGTGIEITDNTVSITLDPSIFIVVSELPKNITSANSNKIYLVRNDQSSGDNLYTEWIIVNNTWEKVGEFSPNLDSYYTKLETDDLLADKAQLNGDDRQDFFTNSIFTRDVELIDSQDDAYNASITYTHLDNANNPGLIQIIPSNGADVYLNIPPEGTLNQIAFIRDINSAIEQVGKLTNSEIEAGASNTGKFISANTIRESFYTKSDSDLLLGNKQETLVSGTNIKTINNTSLLGSGNISITDSFVGSVASGITSTNISNWNSKADAPIIVEGAVIEIVNSFTINVYSDYGIEKIQEIVNQQNVPVYLYVPQDVLRTEGLYYNFIFVQLDYFGNGCFKTIYIEGVTYEINWQVNNKITINIIPQSGSTADRPAVATVGQSYFDTTLGRPIWWNGTKWINALGDEADKNYVYTQD